MHVEPLLVRRAEPQDCPYLAAMRHSLWPDATADEHARELLPLLEGKTPGALPSVILVAQQADGRIVGFLEAGLRSHADGCDPAHPVGFVEGWYVDGDFRRSGIGAQLLRAAEEWSRAQGCREMASDTWLDNVESQQVHEALGFEEVDRCVNYRKAL